MRPPLACVLSTVATLALAVAQEPAAPAPPSCRKCESAGVLVCKEHKAELLALERAVERCSVAIGCKRCGGTLAIDCPNCERPETVSDLASRGVALRDWLLARHEAVGRFCKTPASIQYLATAHADLAFGLEGAMVDKRKLDQHQRMHLYGERVEATRRRFCEVFQLVDADFPVPADDASPRLALHMFADPRDMRELSPRLTGIGAMGTNIKLTGGIPVWCMIADDRSMKDDVDVHRVVVHNVVHLLLSNLLPAREIGPTGEGWVDEGIAHWFEHEVDGRCAAYCVEEATLMPGTNWRNGRYRVGIRQLADEGKLRRFVESYVKNSDELDLEENAHAYAWVDYLMATQGGPKLIEFVRRLKARVPQRDAMQAVFGFGPLAMDERFAAWVKLSYPAKETGR
ncbi:MAG: hypothetical protein IT457_14345 [Planctomycetes bacterium]|nr:hypothetical protein [Planctomycetota bacterium]